MANNRMWLICSICNPGKFKKIPPWNHEGLNRDDPQKAIPISSYDGLSHSATGCVANDLNDFFEAHLHNHAEYPFRMEYEAPEDQQQPEQEECKHDFRKIDIDGATLKICNKCSITDLELSRIEYEKHEREQRINELVDTVNHLQSEVKALKEKR